MEHFSSEGLLLQLQFHNLHRYDDSSNLFRNRDLGLHRLSNRQRSTKAAPQLTPESSDTLGVQETIAHECHVRSLELCQSC